MRKKVIELLQRHVMNKHILAGELVYKGRGCRCRGRCVVYVHADYVHVCVRVCVCIYTLPWSVCV